MISQPWGFDKHLVVVQRYEKDIPLSSLTFETMMFQVQVDDISKTKEGGSFIRVRIKIDISLPLCKGRIVTLENGGKSWISLNFKRLPNLCYWCGRLTHGDKDYSLWIQSRGILKAKQKQFNSSLKAPLNMPSNQKVIFVPRQFDQSRLREEVVSRIRENYANTVVENNNVVAPVENNPHMETKEVEDEFIAKFNIEWMSVTNSKTVTTKKSGSKYCGGK